MKTKLLVASYILNEAMSPIGPGCVKKPRIGTTRRTPPAFAR
jgi:hypothetical protein